MKHVYGNLWEFQQLGWLVIPVNVGWKHNGANVMGRGVAAQALEKFPGVDFWWGDICKQYAKWKIEAPVTPNADDRLIFFPTKSLNWGHPELSWKDGSTINRIVASINQLLALPCDPVYLPLVGCGNGGLDERSVVGYLEEKLDNRFTLIKQHDLTNSPSST